MSTGHQPTAAAVRAARQIVPNGTEGTITAALQVMQAAAIIDAEIRPLVQALEAGVAAMDQAYHALQWSKPFGGQSCGGNVSLKESQRWHEDADDSICTANVKARAALTHARGKL